MREGGPYSLGGGGLRLTSSAIAIFCAMLAFGAEPAEQLQIKDGESTPSAPLNLDGGKPSIWEGPMGEGFRSGVESFTVGVGAGYGLALFGGRQHHDLALTSLGSGRMVGPTKD